jgi:transcriptional regulator with XRE-family HTH domain
MTNHFANALQRVIQNRDSSRGAQSVFARQCGIEPANLSRYLSGDSRPDVEWLEKICQPLSDEERVEIVMAYLRDEIPPSAATLVKIISLLDSPLRIAEVPENPLDALPKKKREVIEGLAREFASSDAVFEAFEATWRLLRKDTR